VKSAANVAGAVTAGDGDVLGTSVGDGLGDGALLRVGVALGEPVGTEPDGVVIGAGPGPAPPPEHAGTAIAYANAAHAMRTLARSCAIQPPRSEA
jgi:hypothetical protein